MVKRGKRTDAWRTLLVEFERYHLLGYDAALDDLVVLCDVFETPLPRWAIAALAERARDRAKGVKPKKRMGRHASHRAAQRDYSSDLTCYKRVLDLRREQSLTWVQAYEAVGEELHRSGEAVHKAFARAKKSLRLGKDFYWSELHGG
jgi:hypothetical protein